MGGVRTSVFTWTMENLTELMVGIAVAAVIVVLLYGVRALVVRACKRLENEHAFAAVFRDVVRKTRLWFLVALAVKMVHGYLHPPGDLARTIATLFTIAAALQGALWARALILGVISLRAGEDEGDATSLASAMSIIRLLVSIAVFVIAGIVVLDNLGADVTGLVAGLGIGGIAIGLAAQGIFADLFAALSILFDKPFRVGDTITYQGNEGPITGTVLKIGLKSTRILSLTGELRIMGNTQLLAQEVTNYTGRRLFRHHLPVGIIYQTDPKVAAGIPALMQAEVERAGHRFVRGYFRGFGQSSLDYDLYFEVDTGAIDEAHQALQDVALGILARFNEQGIEFAYPTQTTFTAAPDGTMILPYPQVMPVVEQEPRSR